MKSIYTMRKLEGIQCSVKVRSKIFYIEVNIFYNSVQLIIVKMNLSLSVRL